MHKQMRNFFKGAGLGYVKNVIAAIVQVIAGAPHRAERGIAGDDARKRD
jgi:hypothetical protein